MKTPVNKAYISRSLIYTRPVKNDSSDEFHQEVYCRRYISRRYKSPFFVDVVSDNEPNNEGISRMGIKRLIRKIRMQSCDRVVVTQRACLSRNTDVLAKIIAACRAAKVSLHFIGPPPVSVARSDKDHFRWKIMRAIRDFEHELAKQRRLERCGKKSEINSPADRVRQIPTSSRVLPNKQALVPK